MTSKYKKFYENLDRINTYSTTSKPEEHKAFPVLKKFILQHELNNRRCLEIGSSKGIFQNIVDDYTGVDIVHDLKAYYSKPYFTVNSDGSLPFEDETFDVIWTWAVFEHIPNIHQALNELARVTKNGGYVLFAPAWQCRPWAANGYPVRPYSDFSLKGKLIKASIPFRNTILWRSLFIFPKRIINFLFFLAGKRFLKIRYKKLKPNYEIFWMSDSDAINSIDPHDAILWFESNGFKCISHPIGFKSFFVRNGVLIFKKQEL